MLQTSIIVSVLQIFQFHIERCHQTKKTKKTQIYITLSFLFSQNSPHNMGNHPSGKFSILGVLQIQIHLRYATRVHQNIPMDIGMGGRRWNLHPISKYPFKWKDCIFGAQQKWDWKEKNHVWWFCGYWAFAFGGH